MTDSKWTKGPWYVSLETVVDGEGLAVADCNYGASATHNANLVAAAPDLAEACEKILKSCDSQFDESFLRVDLYNLLIAALRKAKGEA